MTNQLNFFGSMFRPILVAAVISAFASLGFSSSQSSEPHGSILSECEQSAECIMVFAKVGETFEFSINEEPSDSQTDCSIGIGGAGERCLLPGGMEFDNENGILKGVPLKAGFHEFVVLLTRKGVTQERVFLIDIEAAGVNPMQDAYASTFFGAAR